jgi:hypothetical protein
MSWTETVGATTSPSFPNALLPPVDSGERPVRDADFLARKPYGAAYGVSTDVRRYRPRSPYTLTVQLAHEADGAL